MKQIIINFLYIIYGYFLSIIIRLWHEDYLEKVRDGFLFNFFSEIGSFLLFIIIYIFIKYFVKNIYILIMIDIYLILIVYYYFLRIIDNISIFGINIYGLTNSGTYYAFLLFLLYFIGDLVYCIYKLIKNYKMNNDIKKINYEKTLKKDYVNGLGIDNVVSIKQEDFT